MLPASSGLRTWLQPALFLAPSRYLIFIVFDSFHISLVSFSSKQLCYDILITNRRHRCLNQLPRSPPLHGSKYSNHEVAPAYRPVIVLGRHGGCRFARPRSRVRLFSFWVVSDGSPRRRRRLLLGVDCLDGAGWTALLSTPRSVSGLIAGSLVIVPAPTR